MNRVIGPTHSSITQITICIPEIMSCNILLYICVCDIYTNICIMVSTLEPLLNLRVADSGRTSIYARKNNSMMMPESNYDADIQASNLSQMPY